MITQIKTCKECFGTDIQKANCAYEHAIDYKNTYDFFKNKWNEDFPQLLEAAAALTADANACKAERNAALPILQQQEMMNDMRAMMKNTHDMMDDLIQRLSGGKTKKIPSAAPKEKTASAPMQVKMWRPDVKDENVQEAIDQLKEKYPNLDEGDIEVLPNKNGDGHKSIRFKVPA